jgi:hypothetical protein
MTTKGQRQQYTFSEIVDEEDSELLENYLTDVSTPEYPKYRRVSRCPRPRERPHACAPVRSCAFFCFRN